MSLLGLWTLGTNNLTLLVTVRLCLTATPIRLTITNRPFGGRQRKLSREGYCLQEIPVPIALTVARFVQRIETAAASQNRQFLISTPNVNYPPYGSRRDDALFGESLLRSDLCPAERNAASFGSRNSPGFRSMERDWWHSDGFLRFLRAVRGIPRVAFKL